MKVVIAIDSFKGSIDSLEAGMAARAGVLRALDAEIIVKPLADGGEGTTRALVEGLGGEYIDVDVQGPLGETVRARYGLLEGGGTAVMEMAEAAGITLLPREELNPWSSDTYGVGQMILDAVGRGCKSFIVGIGGSATTEGGIGMLRALGWRFLDSEGREVKSLAGMDKIAAIDEEHVPVGLLECRFSVACDVKNPLCGENGAVYVYGPQKGVKEEDLAILDSKLRHFAGVAAAHFGVDRSECEGTGAAGGLGFAFLSFLPHASLRPGIDIVLEAVGLENDLKDADFVITGEGRIDAQTAMGKVPVGVARLAKRYGAKVIAFAGGMTGGAYLCNEEGIDALFPIVRGVTTLEEAMDPENAKENMERAVEQVFRLFRA